MPLTMGDLSHQCTTKTSIVFFSTDLQHATWIETRDVGATIWSLHNEAGTRGPWPRSILCTVLFSCTNHDQNDDDDAVLN